MRAHQIMTRPVITILPDATILEAANPMLQRHISGLPVVDAGRKTGRHRLGRRFHSPQRNRHPAQARPLLKFLLGAGSGGDRFRSRARPQGR